jgi:hypothetical protein
VLLAVGGSAASLCGVASASRSVAVVPVPSIHSVLGVVRFRGHRDVLVKSIEVYGVAGARLTVSCDRCLRYAGRVRISYPVRSAKLYRGVDWILQPGRVVSVRVFRRNEVGRFLLLSARLERHPTLIFRKGGCLSSLSRVASCPRGTATPTAGTTVPQAPSVSNTSPPQPPPSYALSVMILGSGSGSVTGSGIACPGSCSQSYQSGSGVSLSTTSDPGSTFVGWYGACTGSGTCALTMGQAQSVEAVFQRTAPDGVLGRYFNSSAGQHWVAVGTPPSGYAYEQMLGYLLPIGTSGTKTLYSCQAGAAQFLSLDPACEGQTVLGAQGGLYQSVPSGVATVPVYRCNTASNDHFASNQSNCEGANNEGLLGYAASAQSALDRYYNSVAGFHFVTGAMPPNGYKLESTLGYMVAIGTAGTKTLYSCQAGSSQFLSLDPACEGQAVLGAVGAVYVSPPANVATLPVYRCVASSGDHFASNDPNCEGSRTESLLGYLDR